MRTDDEALALVRSKAAMIRRRRRATAAGGAALVLLAVGGIGSLVAGDGGTTVAVVDDETAQEDEAAPTLEELVQIVGCPAPLEQLPEMPGMTSEAALYPSLRCSVGDDIIDFFQRAPVNGTKGGTLANIDVGLGTGLVEEGCEGWVLTGETWFIFSTNEKILRNAEDELDSVVRPVLLANPPVSYPLPLGLERGCGM